MALMIIGQPVIEFLFMAIITIGICAALLYTVLGLFYAIDRVIDYFYIAK
jgi:biopolymer transport protein ExbB/TolQ